MADHPLYLRYLNNTWQVTDKQGNLASPPQLAPGDTITWRGVDGTGAFQFPSDDLFAELNDYTASVDQGESLRLTRASSTGIGIPLVYAVYCTASGTPGGYAEGGSPPRIILLPG